MRTEKREWSNKRLRAMISLLVKQCQFEKVNICLLIDGLDEFEGHLSERSSLLKIVEELVQCDYVKAIISSRPEPPFVERLSSYKHLQLQELTENDIREYVEDTLLQEDLMLNYRVSQSLRFKLLIF